MPLARDLLRAYREPKTSERAHQFFPLRTSASLCLESGQRLDFFGPDGRRLGWARVEPTGDISLFDIGSNRVGTVRVSAYANGNGARAYQQIDPKALIEQVISQHPNWAREQILAEVKRELESTPQGGTAP